MNESFFQPTTPPRFRILTGMPAMLRQQRDSVICPETPRLDGKLAIVTGGNGGIGFETCRGLLRRGAEVIMASRSEERAEQACSRLREELGPKTFISQVNLDLSDLNSVVSAVEEVRSRIEERAIDLLVANAGVWRRSYSTSAQGHELTFATNVLGHFLLIRQLIGNLVKGARVIVITGDIYVLSKACTPDYPYRGSLGGMRAYCRSKLGNLWLVAQLQERNPDLLVLAVHPGVVSSNLARNAPVDNSGSGRGLLIDSERGAQTTLVCATTRAEDLILGGYYHNLQGLMALRPNDPARNERGACELWETCERLCRESVDL